MGLPRLPPVVDHANFSLFHLSADVSQCHTRDGEGNKNNYNLDYYAGFRCTYVKHDVSVWEVGLYIGHKPAERTSVSRSAVSNIHRSQLLWEAYSRGNKEHPNTHPTRSKYRRGN